MQTKEYLGRSVALLGLGRSNRAVLDFLLPLGAVPTVYVPKEPPEDLAALYRAQGVRFAVGAFPARFAEALLVRSPVIRPDLPALAASVAAGAELTSEVELFLRHCPATVVGITGSDGKTTTSALTAKLLTGAGKHTRLGGNNGVPLLPQVWEMTADHVAVLELSSFQLMTLERAPHVAVITNITPNHLDWHTDMAEYVAAKSRILGTRTRFFVTNAAQTLIQNTADGVEIPRALFSANGELPRDCSMALTVQGDRLCVVQNGTEAWHDTAAFHLPGRHNFENLMAAFAAVTAVLGRQPALAALADFHGVAHRLQYVDTVRGVRFYNSSIDTSPTRTAAALDALGGRPIVIAGGKGKGIPLDALADALAKHVKAVVLYGETAEEIAVLLHGRAPTHCVRAFAAAFHTAAALASAGDTVLLSPGCTAFDQFRDFEERGNVFCALVAGLKE